MKQSIMFCFPGPFCSSYNRYVEKTDIIMNRIIYAIQITCILNENRHYRQLQKLYSLYTIMKNSEMDIINMNNKMLDFELYAGCKCY